MGKIPALRQPLELGRIHTMPGAARRFSAAWLRSCLERHAAGDYGDLDSAQRMVNERSSTSGGEVLSQYVDFNGARLWIITAGDRSRTTLLLPEEYPPS